MNFSHLNLWPFIIGIVGGFIIIIIAQRIGTSGSNYSGGGHSRSGGGGIPGLGGTNGGGGGLSGDSDIIEVVAQKASDLRFAQRQKDRRREDAQRNLIHQIKLSGILSGISFMVSLSVLSILLDAVSTQTKDDDSFRIIIPASILLMGTIFTIVFTVRFFQLKHTYNLYYGPLFGKKA